MRDENISTIFAHYVKKLNDEFKTDPTQLPEVLHVHYSRTCGLMNAVNTRLEEVKKNQGNVFTVHDLNNLGIGVKSFCQTWLRNGKGVGDAQFSVMSPHFQTRFYIMDEATLRNSVKVTAEHYKSYAIMANHFGLTMADQYGVAGGGQAFIDIDLLLDDHEFVWANR